MCLQEGPRTFVGIATFDSTIHFYNLKRALQQVNCCTSFHSFVIVGWKKIICSLRITTITHQSS